MSQEMLELKQEADYWKRVALLFAEMLTGDKEIAKLKRTSDYEKKRVFNNIRRCKRILNGDEGIPNHIYTFSTHKLTKHMLKKCATACEEIKGEFHG